MFGAWFALQPAENQGLRDKIRDRPGPLEMGPSCSGLGLLRKPYGPLKKVPSYGQIRRLRCRIWDLSGALKRGPCGSGRGSHQKRPKICEIEVGSEGPLLFGLPLAP